MKSALALAAAAPIVMATPGLKVRPRGLIAVRNEGNPTAILAEIQRTFDEMKTQNEARLKALENGRAADPLNQVKVDAISAEITSLQKAMDDTNRLIAALKVGAVNENANDTPERAEHRKSFNKWFRRGESAVAENSLRDLSVKAKLTTDQDTDGGYVVPTEMEKTIDRVLGQLTAMRGLARVISISTNAYKKPFNQGGATSGWVGEREARPETNTPKLNMLEFPVMEMYANPAATQQILDDAAINIEQWLADEVQITFAEQEGAAFVTGDGVSKPRGILSYTNVANASYAWGSVGFIASGNSAGFITPTSTASPADCLISLLYSLKQGYRSGASFLTSDPVMGTIRQFKDGQGNYIWAPPANSESVPTILGKPVYTDDNMQALGANAYPVAVADFKRAYLIIDRVGIRVLRDPYTNKPYIMFYTTKRVGGGIQNYEAIKLLKCA